MKASDYGSGRQGPLRTCCPSPPPAGLLGVWLAEQKPSASGRIKRGVAGKTAPLSVDLPVRSREPGGSHGQYLRTHLAGHRGIRVSRTGKSPHTARPGPGSIPLATCMWRSLPPIGNGPPYRAPHMIRFPDGAARCAPPPPYPMRRAGFTGDRSGPGLAAWREEVRTESRSTERGSVSLRDTVGSRE